jgi:filamentous hemagglutinin
LGTQFEELFNKAGYTLEDDINKILVEGHFGGHPDLYHDLILAALKDATAELEGSAYTAAFENAMSTLQSRVTDVNDILNALITR